MKSKILYDQLVATIPSIERKGKTTPYTSVNGHMFSFLAKDGSIGLRLTKEDRDAFIVEYTTKLMVQHGKVMKEYVLIPEVLLNDVKLLSHYFELSYSYVSNLKPKSSKKKTI